MLGIVTHLTAVEQFTCHGQHVTRWPDTFTPPTSRSVTELVGDYQATNQVNDYLGAVTDLT